MLYLYSILDKVANSWLTVSLFSNDDVAKRSFIDLLNSAGFNPHKGDYAIYRLGTFNPEYFAVLKTDYIPSNPISNLEDPYLVFDGAYLKKESVNE